MSALIVSDVAVTLGGNPVLCDVSARFERGRITALLGPNGAGKSTLLSCLAGLRMPDEGRIDLDGADVTRMDRRDRARRIGFLPQSPEVHWDVDVKTLVGLGRLPHHGRFAQSGDDEAAVLKAMRDADVLQFANRSARQLSGGERARALLARVLAGEPEWLLADEPLASLDPAHQLDVLAQLRVIAAAGTGVILVLHDLSHAARIADDILLIREGRVVKQGARDQVIDADRLRQTFDIEVHIGDASSGRFVIPLRRSG